MSVSIDYDASTKKLILPPNAQDITPQIKIELDQLNILISEVIGCNADVPPQPTPQNFDKEKSNTIKKLYESGVGAFKLGKYHDSVKFFTDGINVISNRYKFESFQFTLQELGLFLMSRADAYLKSGDYLPAFNDADMLIGMMLTTPDNFLRRGVANFFLGNYELSRADYQRGLALDQNNQRLLNELEVCLDKILEENGDEL